MEKVITASCRHAVTKSIKTTGFLIFFYLRLLVILPVVVIVKCNNPVAFLREALGDLFFRFIFVFYIKQKCHIFFSKFLFLPDLPQQISL